jgi:hypothetical protein
MDLTMKFQDFNLNMERSRSLAQEARIAELEVKVKSFEERLDKAEETVQLLHDLYNHGFGYEE